MVIPRTFIESEIPHTRKGWRVVVHTRPRKSIFPRPKSHFFPTREEARAWAGELWAAGNTERKRNRVGHTNRLTTQTVLWVSDQLVPTGPYADLPEVRAVRHADGLTVYLGGQTIATAVTRGRDLKRAILDHPLGDCLSAASCARCGRKPRINLLAGTLTHDHPDCMTRLRMEYDILTPPTIQIALWNRYFSRRMRPTDLMPVSRPCFMILGALREPSERDMMRQIRAIEVIQ